MNKALKKSEENLGWAFIGEQNRAGARHDPLFHLQQFPLFMNRSSLLSESYEKETRGKSSTPVVKVKESKYVSRFNPSQTVYEAYGRVQRHKNKAAERKSFGIKQKYDEAVDKQIEFVENFPLIDGKKGNFKVSCCPEQDVQSYRTRRKRKRKGKETGLIWEKNWRKRKNIEVRIPRETVSVLISWNSPRKCENCREKACRCAEFDKELPETLSENLSKGRTILTTSKQQRLKKFFLKNNP